MEYTFNDYKISTFKDDRDGDVGAFIEEIPEVSAFAPTAKEAVEELEIVFNGWLQIAKEFGDPIPTPLVHRKYSGKTLLRMPKSLHEQVAEQSEKDQVSINQEIVYLITTGLERKKAHNYCKMKCPV